MEQLRDKQMLNQIQILLKKKLIKNPKKMKINLKKSYNKIM